MPRVVSMVAAFAGLVAPCALQQAHAQLPLGLESPAEFVREALAHPYGRALIAEFSNAVIESADDACLSGRRLNAAELDERGRDLFQRYGTRTMSMLQQNVDQGRYDAELAKRAGAKAKAKTELAPLRKHPSVQAYAKLERPIRLAKVLDFVVEQFDRYVLLNRIKLKPISPLATGDDRLMAVNPTEASEEALERFMAGRKPRQLQRYVALSEAAGVATMSAFNREAAGLWGPKTFYSGVEDDLAELCILSQQ
jgi:hypothetical protein